MNKKIIALLVLVAAVVVTGYSVSGTYAKYTEKLAENTQSKATVAKWAFDIKEGESAKEEFKFNVFDTEFINKSVGVEKDGKVDSVENLVIAPGSKSTAPYKMTIKNDSDVHAKVDVTIGDITTMVSKPNLKYTIKMTNDESESTVLTSGVISEINWGGDIIVAPGKTLVISIEWEWPYEGSKDSEDLASGKESATSNRAEVILQANVTATQIDPATVGA